MFEATIQSIVKEGGTCWNSGGENKTRLRDPPLKFKMASRVTMVKDIRRKERLLIGRSRSSVAMDTAVLGLLPRLITNLG